MMNAADVIQVVDALEANGVAVWVNGGWGVDALLGEQTRPHDDLDAVISVEDVELTLRTLGDIGFSMMTDELPQGFVVCDASDRRVDFHPVRFRSDGAGAQPMNDGAEWIYPAEGFSGSGSIGGQTIRCLTAEVQVLAHIDYDPDETDRSDMRSLRDRFGVDLPPSLQ